MWEFVSAGPDLFQGAGHLLGVGSGQWKPWEQLTVEEGREEIKGQNTKSSWFGQLVNSTLNDKVPVEKGDKN